jgi:thiamine biosynthesis lipoprotein
VPGFSFYQEHSQHHDQHDWKRLMTAPFVIFTFILVFSFQFVNTTTAFALASGKASPLCENLRRIPSMGSFFEIQIITPCRNKVRTEDFVYVQKQLDQMESEMSLYQSESALSQLNRQGFLAAPIPAHLGAVVKSALEIYEQTDHVFDVTIWPVLSLIQSSFKKNKVPPTDFELDVLRPLIGAEKVQFKNSRIEFQKRGMGITLDGIAKGYAVDIVAEFFVSRGFENYLLNFSGNMKWRGQGLNSQGKRKNWKIKIWDPVYKKLINIDKLPAQGAIASSGGANESYDLVKKWHHIIDPKSLKPANNWIQTTVVGPLAKECDVLSTATYIMNDEQIRKIIKKGFPNYRVYVLDQTQSVRAF